jgi:hypothetical protein
MLDPFPLQGSALTSLPLWNEPLLLPAPEEVEWAEPTPNRLANVFRAIKKKTRKKNKHSRKSRRANKK